MSSNDHTLGYLLLRRAESSPHVLAIVEGRTETSYRDLADRSVALAKGFFAMGVRRGDRVVLLMPNSLEYAACFYACGLIGAVAVNINARLKTDDLGGVIRHSQPALLVTSDTIAEFADYVSLVLRSAPEWVKEHPIILSGAGGRPPAIDIQVLIGRGHDVVLPDIGDISDDTALILYTSGTTASPKGCEITHRALVKNWSIWADLIGIEVGEAVWVPCPFFHIGGVGPLVGVIAAGGIILTAPHFDPVDALEQLTAYRPPHLFPAFPALTLGVLRERGYHREDFGFVRTVHSAAPPETQRLIQSLVPDNAIVTSNFGMTEGAGPITFTLLHEPDDVRLLSTGVAYPGYDVRVADSHTNVPLPVGEPGEIQFRSDSAFHGYFNDPTATAATVLAEGWIKSGDMGSLDDAGHLAYLGRINEMIKVGGENVSPIEVEAALGNHPAVRVAQLVGRDDERLGEVPIAFVELADGAHVDQHELIEWLSVRIASFKVPREVIFVDEWPMSATKILKSKLRELAGQ